MDIRFGDGAMDAEEEFIDAQAGHYVDLILWEGGKLEEFEVLGAGRTDDAHRILTVKGFHDSREWEIPVTEICLMEVF